MVLQPHTVAKCVLGWIGVVCFILIFAFYAGSSVQQSFFTCGPNEHLQLLGVRIDTWTRYAAVVAYTVGSTCFRTLHVEVLSPWIMQSVQNNDAKCKYTMDHAMFVIMVSVVFTWLDWFMYLNILLSQLDFLLVEIAGNVWVTLLTTKQYMRPAYTPLP